jgi:hypothetical protein
MAMPTYIGAGALVARTGSGSANIPYPAGIQANDILVIVSEASDGGLGAAGGWIQKANNALGSSGTICSVAWKRATGSEAGNLSHDDGGGAIDHWIARMFCFRGAVTSGDPFNASSTSNSAASSSVTFPTVTTTADDCLILNCLTWADDDAGPLAGTPTNASLANVTKRADGGAVNGNGGGIVLITGEKPTAGAVSSTTLTLSTSSGQGRVTLALRGLAPSPRFYAEMWA